ncbi:MAG: response regulator [Mucilaginibacter sp.]|nr:response regulator [Mucilaginibacter sp.]
MNWNHKPANIYVIDDERIDNMIFKLLVKRLDEAIKVNAIENGQHAIDQLLQLSRSEPSLLPDYIFLDINMPGMNGWQFLNEYDRLHIGQFKKIHIYILSSSVYGADVKKSHANPYVDDFINKPLDFENLKMIFKMHN